MSGKDDIDGINFQLIAKDAESYENKIKSLQRIYLLLIGLSIFFFFVFLYPYYTIQYNLNFIPQLKKIIDDFTTFSPLIKEFSNNLTTEFKFISNLNNNMVEDDQKIKNSLNETQKSIDTTYNNIIMQINEFNNKSIGYTDNNFLLLSYRLLLHNLTSDLTSIKKDLSNKTNILNLQINLLLKNDSKFNKISAGNITNNIDERLSKVLTKFNILLNQQNTTLVPLNQQIINAFEQIESPLFKVPLNLEQIISLFPIAVIFGFIICVFNFIDIIKFKGYLDNSERYKDKNEAKKYINQRLPSWINVDIKAHRMVFFLLPLAIFGAGIAINIHLYISNIEINDREVKISFLQANTLYTYVILALYLISGFLFWYIYNLTQKECFKSLKTDYFKLFKISLPNQFLRYKEVSHAIWFLSRLALIFNIALIVLLVSAYYSILDRQDEILLAFIILISSMITIAIMNFKLKRE